MKKYIDPECVFEALGEKLCSHCSWNIDSIDIDCPSGYDIFDTNCKNYNIACDVAEIVDKANEEICDLV